MAGITNGKHKEELVKFGRHLESLRKEKKLTLRTLATKCDLEYADIKRYENGEINMTFVTLLELAKGLEIELAVLLKYT